ncbi:MAG TPA: DUF4160 domain-containing protein [Microbacteriaceae bacterium]|nr:DUF4160 domain-containing protein [Microbacteriaceae bacterium]
MLGLDGYRFFFYSLENREPAHVHVEHGENTAKFWLEPVNLASSLGFRPHELSRVSLIVEQNLEGFRRAWNEHFDEGEFVRRRRERDRRRSPPGAR